MSQKGEPMSDFHKDINVPTNDAISRQAAVELAAQYCPDDDGSCSKADRDIRELLDDLENLPSAQPEPISEEYARAVWTWLMDYQIRTAKLQGRYTPYEVLGWVVSDWRKENR